MASTVAPLAIFLKIDILTSRETWLGICTDVYDQISVVAVLLKARLGVNLVRSIMDNAFKHFENTNGFKMDKYFDEWSTYPDRLTTFKMISSVQTK